MKRFVPFLLIILLSSTAYCQQYYIVVGAFRIENNAKKFTGYARSKYFDAHYAIRSRNNLFHVYVFRTANRKEAISNVYKVRRNSEFKDAWAYKGFLGEDQSDVVLEPLTMNNPADSAAVSLAENDSTSLAEEESLPSFEDDFTDFVPESIEPLKPKGKFFKFVIADADGNPLPGEVHWVDRREGKDLAAFKTNRYVDIQRSSRSKPMTLVCGIFGFKEVEKLIDYNDPSLTDGAQQDGQGAWVIPFTLQQLDKGDVSVMYKVSFYKDAVPMLPASKTELDQLVHLMTINPDYNITIHGHCNGNYDRKIIALGENKNYFNVKGSTEINGSAKQLAQLRAEAVKSYLIDHGIDASRVRTHSWAGTDMLVDENSNSAKLNDRIEIEVMRALASR